MSGTSLSDPEFNKFDGMDDVCASAYQHAVLRGRFVRDETAAAVDLDEKEAQRVEETLLKLRLLRPMPGQPTVLVPVSPDAAAADLVGPAEHHIRALQQSVSDVRTRMLGLLPDYFESRRRRNHDEAFDVITDIGMVQALINDWGQRCRKDMLTVQPGGPRAQTRLERALPRTLERLERGVRVQHLYQHTVRRDPPTTAYVRAVTAEGAEVRTTDQLIDRMLIYDREIVFLPEQHDDPDRPPGAVVVREPTLVGFLCKLYDHLWARATVFEPDAEDASDITDDVKRAIVRLMAQGHKDELVARRLGMSVRTCRRHISQIMEELAASSRFQAGVNVARSGMLDDE
ncbi:LuxR C-terminal-related transcriptional regulator [Streptomyces sp. NPDC002851]